MDASGNVYVSDSAANTIRRVNARGEVTTFAGNNGTYNSPAVDATGRAARFNAPNGLTVDDAGNLYVADTGNSTIRKITGAGVVTTFAGNAGSAGLVDDVGERARFYGPAGMAVDPSGSVYVADTNNSVIRKITSTGEVTTIAGGTSWGDVGASDGLGRTARFYAPSGLALDKVGNLYVADSSNNSIRKITPIGIVTTLAGGSQVNLSGSKDGTGYGARFNHPRRVTVDATGNIYVADTSNCTIRKVTPAGVVTTIAGMAGVAGSADGPGNVARFDHPFGIAVDEAGNIYVADSYNHTIRKILIDGIVTTCGRSGHP